MRADPGACAPGFTLTPALQAKHSLCKALAKRAQWSPGESIEKHAIEHERDNI